MDELDKNFSAINRLPPYIFEQINSLKMEARRKGEDVIDFSMGNPDGETPKSIVDKPVSYTHLTLPTTVQV